MYEHSCQRAGAEGCGFTAKAATEEELRRKVETHARKRHNVKVMTDTIYNYLRGNAKQSM